MDRETAIREVKEQWKSLFPADKKRRGIICPLCNSGSGAKGTGITSNASHGKPYSLKCWSCGFTGDAIDLIQQAEGLNFNAALEYGSRQLGFTIDTQSPARSERKPTPKPTPKEDPKPAEETRNPAAPAADIANYVEYYLDCNMRLSEPAAEKYLSFRGISRETADFYCLGYDPAWISPTVKKNQQAKGNTWTPEPTARLIIPVNNNHYIARATDPKIKEYAKMNETGGGEIEIFNDRALEETAPLFVVEGAIDALSIIEAGGNAIALNSTSNAQKLLAKLEKIPTKATLILSLDNDEAGQRTQQTLAEGLKRLNISYITADIASPYKDPNEALTADAKAFREKIELAQYNTAARPDNTAGYIDLFMQKEIAELRERSNIKTGFADLDSKSGGLYPGLYVVAATSSLGKTTFLHQIADQLAERGQEIIFFSLEQSRLELVSKSLARITKQMQQGTIKGTTKPENITPLTSLEIRKGAGAGGIIDLAAAEYKKRVADRLSIVEGNFNCNISFIGEYVRRYIERTGSRPVIIVDYLQILQPATEDRRGTTKETIDMTVTELKRISRDNNITVFVVSSVNRTNYLSPIDFESLKESGGIEYTADVIWGLQFNVINEPLFSKDKQITEKREKIRQAKAAEKRDIELVCLKNRYGIASFSCLFDYLPKYDLFTQRTGKQETASENPFIYKMPPTKNN